MTEGSSTARTTVASSSTASARPTPSCLRLVSESVTKVRKTNTMITAALVTTPADDVMPELTASRVLFPRLSSRPGPRGSG